MKRSLFTTLLSLALAAGLATQVQAVNFTSPYSQNFDSMGTSGTAAPAGWKHLSFNMTTLNTTWTNATGIPANGTNSVASIAVGATATTLAASATIPTAANNNGYNAPLSNAATSDRVIATSPTSTTGAGIQVDLTNATGATISGLTITFDTVRYTAVSSANELPGYWVFISTNGTSWTNVTPNPTITTVPNTVGITATTLTASGLSIAPGSTFYIRWVDDNAAQTSPDQNIGLNNVVISTAGNQSPTVAITSPTAGATFTAPASVPITVNAADTDGAVAKVEFFNGATKIGESTTSPFSFIWTGVTAGAYSLTAVATDNAGATTTSAAVNIGVSDGPPTVALTAPTEGASFAANATVSLAANAAGAGAATISKVEFFAGAMKIGEDTTAPYTFDWSGMTPGNYALTAKATDSNTVATTSTAVNITVVNASPTVALTEPDPDQVFNAAASIYMTANAMDSDGTIAKVEYFANGTKVGEATTAPYAFFWNNVFTGAYTLIAKATDNFGATGNSAALNVTVTNPDNVLPSIAITSPTAGVVPTGNVTINVAAADTDGLVSKVEFFSGATKLGESTTAPFSFTWSSVTAGVYTLTATATDNDGGVTTSDGVTINVQAPILTFSENFDSMGQTGTAAPTGWSFLALSGSHDTFSYSPPQATTFLPNSSANAINVGTGTSTTTANATLIANTGPTAAASGTQGFNFGLTASPTDRALGSVPTGVSALELQWSVTNISGTAITGIRVGYDIRRFSTTTNNNTAYNTSPYSGIEELPGYWLFYSLDNGTTWTNVTALNPTLSGAGVQVPNSIGVTTVPPTNVTLTSSWPAGGTLLLRWVDDNAQSPSPDQMIALDNVTLAGIGTQVGASPTVALTSPVVTDAFTAPATVNITADASDSDGTVTKVEFYNGGTKLGEDTTAPYSYSWSGVVVGTYSITARATDNDGNVAVSTPATVTVNSGPGSGTLTRAAYLQQAGPTTMTIRWRSSQAIAGRVQYGSAPASLTTSVTEGAAVTDHEVTLTGLTPNTTYFYNIGSVYDTLAGGDAAHQFTTPPVIGSTPSTRVWVLGDAGTGSSSQTSVRDAFYNWTGARDPNLVLELGDNAYNSGLDSEFQAKVFDIYGSLMKRVPFWSCLGNHETNQATSFVDTYPYFSIYSFPRNAECGGTASGTEHYYSFDYGNIHFISLDSMTASRATNGAMATWLTNDLASTTQTWIVAFWHHPPYTKGSHDSDTETELVQMRTNILPILEAGGVDLVLGGHSHCYERSYLLDGHYGTSGTLTAAMKKNAGDGRPAGNGAYTKPLFGNRSHLGAVYSVAGSSGQISGGSLNHPAHFISLNNLGSLVLDVSGTTLNATFVRETGAANDTYSIVKQGGTVAPIVSSSPVTGVTSTSAMINGLVNPAGTASTAKFQFGTSNTYGTDTAVALSPNDGTVSQSLNFTVTGLQPGTTYHYRVSANNSFGTSAGLDVTFTTLTPFQQWATEKGLSGQQVSLNGDSDGDGHTALEEWAFGTNPASSAGTEIACNGSTVSSHGGPTTLNMGTAQAPSFEAVFLRRKDAAAAGLTYTPYFSADLTQWTPSTDTPTVIASDTEMELVGLPYPLINGVLSKFFKVTLSAP